MDPILDYLRANILGCIAIAISLSSAYYSMRQTRAAEAQLRRKNPVMEVRDSTQAEDWRSRLDRENPNPNAFFDNIFQTVVIIRNTEPTCSLRVIEIDGSRGNVSFIELSKVSVDDGYGNNAMPSDLPDEKLAKSASLGVTLTPFGSQRSEHLPRGDIWATTLLSRRPLEPSALKLRWKWADGLKS